MRAVLFHELGGYFRTAAGYIFLAMYTLLAGVVFVFINIGQEMSASANLTLSAMQLPFLLIAPLLTMRLFAEERRMKTDQLLFTAPVRLLSVVLGKFFSACFMLAAAMGLTGGMFVFISRYAEVSFTETLCVFLGYFLSGCCMLSAGMLISALCRVPLTAGLITLCVNVLFYLAEQYLPKVPSLAFAETVLRFLPGTNRLGDLANGLIGLSDMVVFLAFIALFVFLTVLALEGKRVSGRKNA